MHNDVAAMAFQGNWTGLLPLLREHPELVNYAKEPKGYTPLHQAAWHGVSPSVIGELLALGANPSLRTNSKNQSAREIAAEKHEHRADLQFLLAEGGRTASQLIRKVVAGSNEFFTAYDGNQMLCDRLVEAFGADSCCQNESDTEDRFAAAFKAATGVEISSRPPISIAIGPYFKMQADPSFWANRFLSAFRDCASRSHITPIEAQWATVADLFDPAPHGWGLRGDLFLWLEMRSALNHVPIPDQPDALARIISSMFFVLTGEELTSKVEVRVNRFERGGMSSGMVCGEFWSHNFIPMMKQRAQWLREAWGYR